MKRISIIAALVLLASNPASAHVVLAEAEAPANSYYVGYLRVGHGCDGSPTIALRVEIPPDVIMARPQPKPGWTLEIEHQALAAPVQFEGRALTERVSAITWRGELPADQFDQFGLMLKLPDQRGALFFPVTQTCAAGETQWRDIPAAGVAMISLPHPAPVLTLTASPQEDDGHAHHH